MAIGLVDYSNTLTLGRKRVVVSNDVEASPQVTTPLKKICSREISSKSQMSPLEAIPQDILVITEIWSFIYGFLQIWSLVCFSGEFSFLRAWRVFELQVQVLCSVDHEDLKQLFHVSKTIRDAVSVRSRRLLSPLMLSLTIDCWLFQFVTVGFLSIADSDSKGLTFWVQYPKEENFCFSSS